MPSQDHENIPAEHLEHRGYRLRTLLEERFTAERAPDFSRPAQSVAHWRRKISGRGSPRTGLIPEDQLMEASTVSIPDLPSQSRCSERRHALSCYPAPVANVAAGERIWARLSPALERRQAVGHLIVSGNPIKICIGAQAKEGRTILSLAEEATK